MHVRGVAHGPAPAHSLHSTRHTFITWARRGGARSDVLEVVTHNAAGKMIDQYTHWDWEPLCDAVACLNYASGVKKAPGEPQKRAAVATDERVTSNAFTPPFGEQIYDAAYDVIDRSEQFQILGGGGAGNRSQRL
jgi:hypothetical protein